MGIFKDLKTINTGKFSLFRHISLFSLLGILVMSFNRYFSFITNNVFADFLGFVNANNVELFFCLLTSVMFVIFFIGYYYKFINNLANDVEELPDFTLSCFSYFLKIIPLSFIWFFYFLVFMLVGFLSFPITSTISHVYFAILICLIPFINLIFVSFAENFNFDKKYLNPFLILVVLDRALGAVIYLTLKVFVLTIIPCAVVYLLPYLATKTNNVEVQAILKTFSLCFAGYSSYILILLYAKGLVRISKDKLAL